MISHPSIYVMEFWFLFLYISDKILTTYSRKYRSSMPRIVSDDIDHLTNVPIFRFFLKIFFNINLGVFGDLLIFLLPIYEFIDKIRLDLSSFPILSIAIPLLKTNLLPFLCILCSLNILKKLVTIIFFQPYLNKLSSYKIQNSSLPNPHPKSISYWHKIDQLRRFMKDLPLVDLKLNDTTGTDNRAIVTGKVEQFSLARLSKKPDTRQSSTPSSGKEFFTSVQEKFTRFYRQRAFDLSQDYQDSYRNSKIFLKQAMQSINKFYQEEVLSLSTDHPTFINQNTSSYCAYNLYSIDVISKIAALASSLDVDHEQASETYLLFMQQLEKTLAETHNATCETLRDSFNEALENLNNTTKVKKISLFNFFYSSEKTDPAAIMQSHLIVQRIIYRILRHSMRDPKPEIETKSKNSAYTLSMGRKF